MTPYRFQVQGIVARVLTVRAATPELARLALEMRGIEPAAITWMGEES